MGRQSIHARHGNGCSADEKAFFQKTLFLPMKGCEADFSIWGSIRFAAKGFSFGPQKERFLPPTVFDALSMGKVAFRFGRRFRWMGERVRFLKKGRVSRTTLPADGERCSAKKAFSAFCRKTMLHARKIKYFSAL